MCAIYPEERLFADQRVVSGMALLPLALAVSASAPAPKQQPRVRCGCAAAAYACSLSALRAGRHGSRCRRTLSAALANVMMEALAQHTHGVKDGSEDMLAKRHRAGGAWVRRRGVERPDRRIETPTDGQTTLLSTHAYGPRLSRALSLDSS